MNPKLQDFIIETLFPSRCYNCKKYGEFLCIDCFEKITNIQQIQCPHCARRLPEGKLMLSCRKILNVNRLFITSNYNQAVISRMIKDLKYKRAYCLANELTTFAHWWLKNEGYVETIQKNTDLIVPVPSYIKKLKHRGFNHAEKISEHMSQILNIPIENHLLKKIKATPSQVGVANRKNRENNVKNAYAVIDKGELKQKIVLLIDDVITTGATIRECSKALRKADVKEVWSLVIAKD